MKNPSDVITAVPCLALNIHPCSKCAYNPKPDRTWPYGCVKGQTDLVKDILELLKEAYTERGGDGEG